MRNGLILALLLLAGADGLLKRCERRGARTGGGSVRLRMMRNSRRLARVTPGPADSGVPPT